jgi:hypothetical protein
VPGRRLRHQCPSLTCLFSERLRVRENEIEGQIAVLAALRDSVNNDGTGSDSLADPDIPHCLSPSFGMRARVRPTTTMPEVVRG